jgi:hypothetical protein
MYAHSRRNGTDILFFKLGARWGWVVNEKAQLLHSWERARVSIVQDSGWILGLVGTGAENLTCSRIQSLDCPTRSMSLYRLSYLSVTYN